MNKFFVYAFSLLIFSLPFVASAEVKITEIAWMGTTSSANDEWIEIYNDGSSSVNLSGWSLVAADGTPTINLSGTISAGQYALLERTDDNTFVGINALVIFTGALGNEGENLTLKNGSTVVQNLSFSGGWPAGDVASKETMQWNGSSWITAPESAGAATTASGDDDNSDDDTTSGDDDTTSSDDDTTGDDTTEDDDDDDELSESLTKGFRVYPTRALKITSPKTSIADTPTTFHVEAFDFNRTPMFKGYLILNMGDGSMREYIYRPGKEDDLTFTHIYKYPGTYLVNIKYYGTYFEDAAPDVEETFSVEVISSTLSISKVLSDGAIELKNSSSEVADISGWYIKDSFGREYEIIDGTKVAAGKTLVLSQKRTKLNTSSSIFLLTPTKTTISSYPEEKAVIHSTVKSKDVKKDLEGEVLGVKTVNAEVAPEVLVEEKEKSGRGTVYILLFIILILVAVIAALLLQKNSAPEEEGYKLIDE